MEALPWAEYWYNTAHHSTIKMTPFQALYGYGPPAIRPYVPAQLMLIGNCRLDMNCKLFLKRNLEVAQSRMKLQYDKRHVEREFHVGDWVYFETPALQAAKYSKKEDSQPCTKVLLSYQVEERIGSVSYKLQLPASAKIHPIFHVSLLKKKIGSQAVTTPHLPP
ncbi:uncharacterized protein LOC126787218 [Argentina anserina]|uniref:uncharacterized protein LOC126787218 n=1 Tax=Argentina anserina TaxID=57926 RepID=UPI002176289B|nr:uncharacterized protein LOC126787218 [Potentilla anserina]